MILLVILALHVQGVAAAVLPCRIFFVPGAFGEGTSSLFLAKSAYFSEYRSFFEAKGCAVKTASFPPDASIEERALVLKDQLGRFLQTGAGKAVLIAHSQGALDARFALRTLGVVQVEALISVGAPHLGTPVAEWAVDHRDRGSFLYWFFRVFAGYDLRALSFVDEMTPRFLKKFHSRFEKQAGVRYASAQGVCQTHCHWALVALSSWINKGIGQGHGDGIVSKESQLFGDDLGQYDLDHISEVGNDSLSRNERTRLLEQIWKYLH
ncbi:hypothetical protein WDW37_10660 [Bdellovibrionota bacterium FG-1]